MILIIFILTLSLYSIPANAQEFIEYQSNPVISKGDSSNGIAQPFVSKKEGIFSIWFSDSLQGGLNRISNMKSANGIDWYDKKVLSVSNQQTLAEPFIVENNGEYLLYFDSLVNGSYTIWRSTSIDGITFTPGQEVQVLKPELSWERTHVTSPSVIEDDGIWYLFYSGTGTINWSLGLATSSDGINWQKCPNNPFVLNSAGPHIIKQNDLYYLYYQSTPGLQVQQTDRLNGCNTIWSSPRTLTPRFTDPSPLIVGNDLWLYGFSNTSSGMSIWLAANVQIPKPSYPVVIIPGMFSSWNADALLHNSSVDYDAWKLNPGVTEYSALMQTFANSGRIENKDYFLFPYDWRKPIVDTTNDLDSFLTTKIWAANPYQPIQIVGHSLGGVVSRIYADKNPIKPIKQIISAGSPLQGMVQAYKPLSTGEIERENTLTWIAMKIILFFNKPLFQSESEALAQKFPVLFDILPAFPFLKDANGSFYASPLINSLITQYPVQSVPKIPQYYMGGVGAQTLAGYTPTSSWKEEGDGTVLAKSHLNALTPAPIQNHGEIIYSKESIKNIASKLGIPVSDADIPAGKATSIFPAILVFLQSPAEMQIEHGGATTQANDGMIWLQNSENGSYTLRVTGTASGEYTVSLWLIGSTNDKWIQFKKQTTSGKVDEYAIIFNGESGGSATEIVPPTPTLIPSPTAQPTIIPTLKPTVKPTCKPHPTKMPTPTKAPPKKHKSIKIGHWIQVFVRYIIQLHKK